MHQFPIARWAVCLTFAAATLIGDAHSAEPTPSRTPNVILQNGGLLSGIVVDETATPLKNITVDFLDGKKVVVTQKTNEKGEFRVKGMRNGTHVVRINKLTGPVHLWSVKTAPPKSDQKLVIVHQSDLVRGQDLSNLLDGNGPLILGAGALGTVLAITLSGGSSSPEEIASP